MRSIIKNAILVISSVACLGVRGYASDIHDFTFGLSDEFAAQKPYENSDTGMDIFNNFMRIKNTLPKEVSLFNEYEIEGKYEIYVSPQGSDINPGTKEKPLKTIDMAFKKISSINNRTDGIVIYLREGSYDVRNGLIIPEYISGTTKHPTIISSYEDEDVVLTGGISLNGKDFGAVNDEKARRKLSAKVIDKVKSIDLKQFGYYEYPKITSKSQPKLTVNNSEYTLARWPNSETISYAQYKGTDGEDGVISKGPAPGPGGLGNEGEGFEFQFINPRPLSWENDGNIYMYGSFDWEWIKGYQRIDSINEEKMSIKTSTCTSEGARFDAKNKYYYLNILEELDSPGEWYLDHETGILYIYPATDLSESHISLSLSSNDLVTFEKSSEYIVLNGVTVSDTNGKGIVLSGYRNLVQNCIVESTALTGIHLYKSKNSGVINSRVYGNLTVSDNLNDGTRNSDGLNLRPTRNFVQNNYVINGSLSIRRGVQNIVSHNTVMNPPIMGIYIAQTQESIVEYNEVVGGPWSTLDAGTVYSEGGLDNLYNHIRYNYVHDSTMTIRNTPYSIYFDDLTSNTFAYGNIVHEGMIFFHGGSFNVAYNNVILDNTKSNAVTNGVTYVNSDSAYQKYLKLNGAPAFEVNGEYKLEQVTWKNRYPYAFQWLSELQNVRRLRQKPGYTRGDEEIKWIAPRNNCVKNNVIYNSNFIGGDVKYETGAYREDNFLFDTSDIFENYNEKNYSIADYATVRSRIPNFEDIPQQSHMGVTEDVEAIKQGKIYPILPLNDDTEGTFNFNLELKWTSIPTVTYYDVEVAKDKDFNEIVWSDSVKSNAVNIDEDLELDCVYYWRVNGICLAQNIKNKIVTMDTATFKTYTYDEAAKNTVLELSEYNSLCNDILKIADEADMRSESEADINIGMYKKETKQLISDLINKSNERVKGYALQKEVIDEIEGLKVEFYKIIYDNSIPYERKYNKFDINDWESVKNERTKIDITNNTLKFISKEGINILHDIRKLAPSEAINVRVNFGEMKEWDAMAIKQVETADKTNVTMAKGYYVVVKQDAIELQKYPADNGRPTKATVKNDGIIKPNEYHDIKSQIKRTDDNNLRILFEVDGKVIFDFVDEINPIFDLGYFSIQSNIMANSGVAMMTNADN